MSIATVTPLHPAARPAAHPAVRAQARRAGAGRPALRLVDEGRVDRAVQPVQSGRAARPAQSGRAARPAQAAQVAPAPLRLTRRGRAALRLLALLAMLALVGAGVLALQGTASAGQGAAVAPAVTYHVVLPGETLWGIARQIAPEQDTRETVARIVELNALPGAQVYAGQRIALQAGR